MDGDVWKIAVVFLTCIVLGLFIMIVSLEKRVKLLEEGAKRTPNTVYSVTISE